jgi:YD repeat-containing protein
LPIGANNGGLDANTRSYQYDFNGNVIRMTDRDGRVTTYVYDRLNEKLQEQWLDGSWVVRTLSYVYDAAGNLTSTSDPSAGYTYAYDSLNRPTSVTTALPGLDPSVTLASQYDNAGNRTQLSTSLTDTSTQVVTPDFVNPSTYDSLGQSAGAAGYAWVA